MNWLQRLWVWLTDVPELEPDPAERRSVIVDPYLGAVTQEESPEAASMPSVPEIPYSVQMDELTDGQKAERASPTVTLSVPAEVMEDGPHCDPGARKTPQKPRKRRTRKHK